MSRGTLDPVSSNLLFAYVALTLYGRPSHAVLLSILNEMTVRNPGDIATSGLA